MCVRTIDRLGLFERDGMRNKTYIQAEKEEENKFQKSERTTSLPASIPFFYFLLNYHFYDIGSEYNPLHPGRLTGY